MTAVARSFVGIASSRNFERLIAVQGLDSDFNPGAVYTGQLVTSPGGSYNLVEPNPHCYYSMSTASGTPYCPAPLPGLDFSDLYMVSEWLLQVFMLGPLPLFVTLSSLLGRHLSNTASIHSQGYRARLMQTLLNGARMDPQGFLQSLLLVGATVEFGCLIEEGLGPLR